MKTKTLLLVSILLVVFSCKFESKTKVDLGNKNEIINNDSTKLIKIGVAAMLSPKEALPAYEEIVKYIGDKLNVKAEMLFTKDYAAMNELIKTKKVFAAFVCSGLYTKKHDEWGMELIVAPELHGKPAYYSYILANKKSNIYKLGDLKGKSFAFTDPESNTGTLVPTYELAKLGTTPDEFFSDYFFAGNHDKAIEAVAGNFADGAAVDHLIWEYMNSFDSTFTSKTRIIAQLGPFCIPPFVTYPEADIVLKQKIKTILLDMHKNPEGIVILSKLLIDKFVVIEDDCYNSIREMEEYISNLQ